MGCRPLEELDEDSHESMTQGGGRGESAIETQGRYVPPAQRANPVLTVENCLSEITLGTFVTVHLDDCDN